MRRTCGGGGGGGVCWCVWEEEGGEGGEEEGEGARNCENKFHQYDSIQHTTSSLEVR